MARWPATYLAYAARVCCAQQPDLAYAVLAATRRLMRYRTEAAGHLLQAFGEPSTLAVEAVEPLSSAIGALPAAHSRAFCERLPQLATVLPARDLVALAEALVRLPPSAHGGTPWLSVLEAATSLAAWPGIDAAARHALVVLLVALAPREPTAVVAELRDAAGKLARLPAALHAPFLALAKQLAERDASAARAWLREGLPALAAVAAEHRAACLGAAGLALTQHPEAPLALLESSVAILREAGAATWRVWLAGATAHTGFAALAYLRRQSRRSAEVLRAARREVALADVQPVLARYCAALAGQPVEIAASPTGSPSPLRDGDHSPGPIRIALPASLPRRHRRLPAFARYKVMATHQVAHVEFGTHTFALQRPARYFATRRPRGAHGGLDAFLALFSDPSLAHAIFTILEDARVDACAVRQYGGLAADYRAVQRAERRARPPIGALPPRAALLEALIRLSLGGRATALPATLRPLGHQLRRVLRVVERPAATVEDAAEATLRLYPLFRALPAAAPPELTVSLLHPDELPPELASALSSPGRSQASDALAALPSYRQHEDPVLSAALARARAADPVGGTPLSLEELRRLLERGLRDLDLAEGDAAADQGLFVTDLRDKPPVGLRVRASQQAATDEPMPPPGRTRPLAGVRRFVYDEWDFRARDYRPAWCQLFERVMDEGSADFVAETLAAYPGVAAAIRRRILQMRPHRLAKRRGLPEGEDLDLDAAIERVIALRARREATDRIYWQRQRLERDVAVTFLLDMSASTDAEVATNGRLRRIIDVEKEGLILLSAALESVGDRYGIYGFSGYGRENVEYYVIKELDERFSSTVARRIAGVRPLRSTRMGPAIRHTTAKLERSGAALRLLLLLSDGYPQDYDYYGVDRLEREYALHDTRMALLEARRRGVVPFCLTVDQAGYDYLRTMCAGLGYEVIGDLATLPERLATLYARLTR